MDLSTYLNNAVKVQRMETMSKSDQLTLGELILKLEPIVKKQLERVKEGNDEATVVYDFEYLFPTKFNSWRGIYAELALNFNTEGKPLKVSEFYKICKETLGKTFEGYKGGEFTMSKITPIWVANYGNAGSTALIDVVDDDYTVILITAYRES